MPLRAGGSRAGVGSPAPGVRSRASWRSALGAVALLTMAAMPASPVRAHDVPDRIDLLAFVKPEGDTLHLLVRVPLVMLLNLNLPKDGRGFLALDVIDQALARAAGVTAREVVIYENGRPLEYSHARARISMPSDRSFESYESALAAIDGASLPASAQVFWNQGYFDAHFQYPLATGGDYAIELRAAPGLRNRLRLHTRYLLADGDVRAYEIGYDDGSVPLDPHWSTAAATFVAFGAQHILGGFDHLLFLVCLVAPFRMRHAWRLLGVVTAFTVGHSVTLIAAATGTVSPGPWFAPLVEVLIALSILYMAIENVCSDNLRRRWLAAALFGLVHGFGFAVVLQQDLQFAGTHLLVSLLAFNVGVELGQVLLILPLLLAFGVLLRTARALRYGLIVLSLLAGHTAWHWMLERYAALSRADWPDLPGAPTLAALVGLAVLATVVAGALLARRRQARSRASVQDATESPLAN